MFLFFSFLLLRVVLFKNLPFEIRIIISNLKSHFVSSRPPSILDYSVSILTE